MGETVSEGGHGLSPQYVDVVEHIVKAAQEAEGTYTVAHMQLEAVDRAVAVGVTDAEAVQQRLRERLDQADRDYTILSSLVEVVSPTEENVECPEASRPAGEGEHGDQTREGEPEVEPQTEGAKTSGPDDLPEVVRPDYHQSTPASRAEVTTLHQVTDRAIAYIIDSDGLVAASEQASVADQMKVGARLSSHDWYRATPKLKVLPYVHIERSSKTRYRSIAVDVGSLEALSEAGEVELSATVRAAIVAFHDRQSQQNSDTGRTHQEEAPDFLAEGVGFPEIVAADSLQITLPEAVTEVATDQLSLQSLPEDEADEPIADSDSNEEASTDLEPSDAVPETDYRSEFDLDDAHGDDEGRPPYSGAPEDQDHDNDAADSILAEILVPPEAMPRSKPAGGDKRKGSNGVSSKKLNLFCGPTGNRFERTVSVKSFAKLAEDLRILIAIGQANNYASKFLDGNIPRKVTFICNIASKGSEAIEPEQLEKIMRELGERGLVHQNGNGPELTDGGLADIIKRTPSVRLGHLVGSA